MREYYTTMQAAVHRENGFVEIRSHNELIATLATTHLELGHVMAAAPAMLRALQELVDEYDKDESVHIPWRTARAAIKKATQP